jgi:hypothetical protein
VKELNSLWMNKLIDLPKPRLLVVADPVPVPVVQQGSLCILGQREPMRRSSRDFYDISIRDFYDISIRAGLEGNEGFPKRVKNDRTLLRLCRLAVYCHMR